jgi:hypothetical protein
MKAQHRQQTGSSKKWRGGGNNGMASGESNLKRNNRRNKRMSAKWRRPVTKSAASKLAEENGVKAA